MKNVLVAMTVAAALCAPWHPAAAADMLVPGRVTIVKLGKLARFVAKPANRGETFLIPDPGSAGDPTTDGLGGGGGRLLVFDTGAAGAGSNTYELPSGVPAPFGWKGLGNPAGSKGYKYKGTGQAADPCKVVLVKPKVVKAVCRGAGVTLQPPFTGDESVVLSLGATMSDRYCALFGGSTVKNNENIFKRKFAPEPSSCLTSPSGAFLDPRAPF